MTPSTGAGGHDDQQGGPRALQGRRAAVDPARVLGDQEPEQDQLHHREQPPSGHPPRCGMPTYRTVAASTAVASATAARRQHWTVLADSCRQHRSWRCSCRRPRRQPRIETPTGRSRPMKAVSDDHQPYVVCVPPAPNAPAPCRAAGGHAGDDSSSGLLPSGGGRRVERCAWRCAARPCGIRSSLFPPRRRNGSRHCLVPTAAVSMACRSLASSASISPIATRSSGLMNPSLSRKPPARAIASRSGTAQ
jgi:hypothetical protein